MTYFASGQWNAICDRCGFQHKSSELKKDWQDLRVCTTCYEPRHPQDLLKVKPEQVTPSWTRPEAPDNFRVVCDIFGSSAYAGMATADCAKADNTSVSYSFLLNLQLGG